MQLRADIQIQSMIKAMAEVVIPSVDSTNELAVQQAQLVMAHLALMAQRLPLQYRADRDALDRLSGYAAALQNIADANDELLNDALAMAEDVLDRSKADPAELLTSARALTEVLDGKIRNLFATDDPDIQRSVQSLTLAMSREQLLRDRAWLIMQGWEPDAAAVPAIETLLANVTVAA